MSASNNGKGNCVSSSDIDNNDFFSRHQRFSSSNNMKSLRILNESAAVAAVSTKAISRKKTEKHNRKSIVNVPRQSRVNKPVEQKTFSKPESTDENVVDAKNKIRKKLGISPIFDNYWRIEDYDLNNNFFLVHYDPDNIKKITEYITPDKDSISYNCAIIARSVTNSNNLIGYCDESHIFFKYNTVPIDIGNDSSNYIDSISKSCNIILSLRGWIYYINGNDEPELVCGSFPYTRKIYVDDIKDVIKNDKLDCKDNYDKKILHNFRDGSYQPCFGGTVIRLWEYGGTFYISTHKKIHIDRSTWGGSRTFFELFTKGFPIPLEHDFKDDDDGNKLLQLIGQNQLGYNTGCVKVYILSSPSLYMDTRLNTGKSGFIVYLRDFSLISMKDIDKSPPRGKKERNIPTNDNEKLLIYSVDYQFRINNGNPEVENNIRKINNILNYGYGNINNSSHAYHTNGESLIYVSNNGETFKVVPKSARWREQLLSNNCSLISRFFQLLNVASLDINKVTDPNDKDVFSNGDKQNKQITDESFLKLFPRINPEDGFVNKVYGSYDERVNAIVENLMRAVPIFRSQECNDLQRRYNDIIGIISKYITDNKDTQVNSISEFHNAKGVRNTAGNTFYNIVRKITESNEELSNVLKNYSQTHLYCLYAKIKSISSKKKRDASVNFPNEDIEDDEKVEDDENIADIDIQV
jgi:hypothetical protein